MKKLIEEYQCILIAGFAAVLIIALLVYALNEIFLVTANNIEYLIRG